VRDNTNNMASKPEPISAITPNHNQARASATGAPEETVTTCEFILATLPPLASRKSLQV
jgi:hypothetical protein